jgi:predicted ester cyclase
MDKAAVTAFYQAIHGTLGEGGKPPRLVFHEIMTDGDFYSCRFAMSGVHSGVFQGLAATGRPYSMHGITIMRFAGDRVVERWSCADMLGLLVQLGAVTPPAG